MKDNNTIEHEGIVKNINNGKVLVNFIAMSACAHCQMSGFCPSSDMEEKEVEAWQGNINVHIGERVKVVLERHLGMKALWLGYLFPFFLVLTGLFITYALTDNELVSGLASLALLLPYYTGLYLCRSRIGRQYNFTIRKMVQT